VPARATAEQFQLFQRYQQVRHGDGDMASMSFYDYRAMVEDTPIETFIIEFRDEEDRLLSACLGDKLGDGLSAVYSFFAPGMEKRSLGTFAVLWLIERARALRLPYVYLGYWVPESRKMAYKARFRPSEVLVSGTWRVLTDGEIGGAGAAEVAGADEVTEGGGELVLASAEELAVVGGGVAVVGEELAVRLETALLTLLPMLVPHAVARPAAQSIVTTRSSLLIGSRIPGPFASRGSSARDVSASRSAWPVFPPAASPRTDEYGSPVRGPGSASAGPKASRARPWPARPTPCG